MAHDASRKGGVMKRESGENLGQTRCCKFRGNFRSSLPLRGVALGKAIGNGTSQKTYHK